MLLTSSLVAAALLLLRCSASSDLNDHVGDVVKPYAFSIAGWETGALWDEAGDWLPGGETASAGDTDTARVFFDTVDRISALERSVAAVRSGDLQGYEASLETELVSLEQRRDDLAPKAAAIIARQIRETLNDLGIHNASVGFKLDFPPVNFRLSEPPKLLVVSPRDRIEAALEVELKPDMTLEEREEVEVEVEGLGVASLVVDLGGYGGTFPALVADAYGLRFAIDCAIEEWLHQYLVFSPLGFLYLLDGVGITPTYEVARIDETVASMTSKEIGALVYERYYGPTSPPGEGDVNSSGFDFNREMREIRLAVDDYLAHGQVAQAESFMEETRHYLAENGYYIRKLNQAYFAFYGTYADSPTSVDPIGEELRTLRARSASIKDFLDKASQLTSQKDLQALLAP